MMKQFLFSCYKGIYKHKLVNSLPVDLSVFIHPAKILFTLSDLYEPSCEALI